MRASVALFVVVPSAFVALVGACTDQVNPVAIAGPAAEAGADDSATGSDAAGPEDAGATDATRDVGGTGTVAGSVGGAAFTNVMSAYWIGVPDDAATTVLYLIGGPAVACADIRASGWSHTISAGTPILEMILTTKSPAADKYTVSTAASPPVGSAEVQYIFSAPTKNETRSNTGTVTLTTLTPNVSAVGTFKVQFPGAQDAGANALEGAFNAVFCAAGHEP